MRSVYRSLFGIGFVVGVIAQAPAWNGFDIENGFGTTSAGHGPWVYGTKSNNLTTTLSVFTVSGSTTGAGGGALDFWWYNDLTYSRAYHNPGPVAFNGGEGTIVPPGSFMLHPDLGRITAARFFGNGEHYSFVYRWTRLGAGGDVVCSVVENGSQRDIELVNNPHVSGPWKWVTCSLTSGLVVDFCVDQNGPAAWDSTRLEAFGYDDVDTTPLYFQMNQPEYVGSFVGIPVTCEAIFGKYPIPTISTTTNGTGNASLNVPLRGTVVAYLKPSHWLRRRFVVFLTDSGLDMGQIEFINGDVDGDNEVTLADYALLASAFGSVPGDGNWNADADLDGDGEVTLTDYSILSQSFGLIGD